MSNQPQWEDLDGTPGDPRKVGARFYMRAYLNPGTQKYEEREWVDLRLPGDKFVVVSKQVNDKIRREYALQYAGWKNTQTEQAGTRLIDVAWVTRSQVEELAQHGIGTVEKLAEDSTVARLNDPDMGFLRQRAKAHVAQKAEPVASIGEPSVILGPDAPIVETPKRRGRPPKIRKEVSP